VAAGAIGAPPGPSPAVPPRWDATHKWLCRLRLPEARFTWPGCPGRHQFAGFHGMRFSRFLSRASRSGQILPSSGGVSPAGLTCIH